MEKAQIENARKLVKLSDLVRPYTKLRPASGGWMGCCPFHRDRTPSFHVSDIKGTYRCFGCNAWGDTFDFVMQTKGVGFQEAVRSIAGEFIEPTISGPLQREVEREAAAVDDRRRIHHAHELWMKREPIGESLACRYLRDTRGITGLIPDILGYVHRAYCSPLGEEVPALIAPLQNKHGHVTAVQQIFLCHETMDAYRDENGRRIKRTLGAMQDGAVRMGIPDMALGLAGSVEDALAASAMFSLPVWATCGEARFERVWVPEDVEHLIIFADADDPGRKAAKAVEAKHRDLRRVTICYPQRGAKDFTHMAEMRATAV